MTHKRRPSARERPDRPPPWLLPSLLAFTLLARGGVLLSIPDPLAGDPDEYRRLAENVLEHGTFGHGQTPTAYRPPLYPLVLTPCVALGTWSRVAIGTLHLAMGLATVWLVFLLGRRWGLDYPTAALAAALTACDPILLVQSTKIMTETPATLLAVVALITLTAAARRPSAGRAALAGGSLAMAALCRPALLVWAVAAGAALPMSVRGRLSRWKLLGAFTAAVLVVLGPWAIRNQLRLGRPVPTTTHGGYTLLLANNPQFYDHLRTGAWGSVWKAGGLSETWRSRATDDELRANREAYAEARNNIRREPAMFFYSCLVRVGRLWTPLPHQTDADEGPRRRWARYAVGLWYLAELPLAAAGAWMVFRRRGDPAWLWGLLLAASLTAVHTVYWTDLRMRAPMMPVVALAAAAALQKAATGGRAQS